MKKASHLLCGHKTFLAELYAGMLRVFNHFSIQAQVLMTAVTFCIPLGNRCGTQKLNITTKN
jgi:hypothetical protein